MSRDANAKCFRRRKARSRRRAAMNNAGKGEEEEEVDEICVTKASSGSFNLFNLSSVVVTPEREGGISSTRCLPY